MKRIVASIVIFLFVDWANGSISEKHNEKGSKYCGIINCDYYKATRRSYDEYISIANLTNIQPLDGYILRFPIFVMGNTNAQILLTETESPNFGVDRGYEFLIDDSRIAIVNKQFSKEFVSRPVIELQQTDISSSAGIYKIFGDEPTKFLIEVTDTGYIRVYLNNSTEPLIASFDTKPLRAKYVSFRTRGYSSVDYFFNCPLLIDDTLSQRMVAALNVVGGAFSDVPLNDLATQCQWHDAWNGKDLTFFNASLFTHSDSHTNKTVLEIYVVFSRYVRIAFSTDGFEDDQRYYEFVIEDGSDAKLLYRFGYYSSDRLGSFYLKDSSTAVDPIKLTFEFSSNGLIEVFVGPSSYKPSISTTHNSSIIINYVGLASGDTRALYYFGCPVKNVTTIQYDILPTEDFSKSIEENCTKFNTKNQVFTEYFALSSLVANVQPDGFLVRLPLYIRSIGSAQIQLSSDFDTGKRQYYIFVFDERGYTSISKNRNILAKVLERYILSYNRTIGFVLEITTGGKIRIFTEHNKSKPLLEVQDPTVISNLKYIGFADANGLDEFYYNCSKIKGAEVDSAFGKNVQETETQSESSARDSVTVTYPRDRQYQTMSQSSSYQRYPGNRESADSNTKIEISTEINSERSKSEGDYDWDSDYNYYNQ